MVVQLYPAALLGSSIKGMTVAHFATATSLLHSDNVGSSPTGSTYGQVVELGYTPVLGTGAAKRASSTLALTTLAEWWNSEYTTVLKTVALSTSMRVQIPSQRLSKCVETMAANHLVSKTGNAGSSPARRARALVAQVEKATDF